MAPSSGQPLNSESWSKTTLQPNYTSYDVIQQARTSLKSPSSQALEHKQGKYQDGVEQHRDQFQPKIEKTLNQLPLASKQFKPAQWFVSSLKVSTKSLYIHIQSQF